MAEFSDRQRITSLRARAAMFRRAASYMSLHAERDQMERHASSLEQEADALQQKISAAAASRAEEIVETPTDIRASSAMTPAESTDSCSLDQDVTSPDTAEALFRSRAERLREIAATVSERDRDLLLAIAAEYEDMAKTLPEASKPEPT